MEVQSIHMLILRQDIVSKTAQQTILQIILQLLALNIAP
jgi:hypothetical protein